jgi:hypothetical protein
MKHILFAILAVLFCSSVAYAQRVPTTRINDVTAKLASGDVCLQHKGSLWDINYCGQYSGPVPPPVTACVLGGSGYPSCAGAQPCVYYVAPSGGSDTNGGTSSAPFATLAHAQSVMESISSGKVTCLKAGSGGTYNLSASLVLGSSDSGETWQFDPASGADTAVLDGGGTLDGMFKINGASNVTINGLTIQHPLAIAIFTQNSPGLTLANNIICCNATSQSSLGYGGFAGIVAVNGNSGSANMTIVNNYVYNTVSQGIAAYAYNSGDSINGLVIKGNVVLNAVQGFNDGGAIYTDMRNSNIHGGSVSIENNFVRDYGNTNVQGEGIYLDDDSSDVTVTGNIVGPPSTTISAPSTWTADTIINGGCCNTWSGNIIDLGIKSSHFIATWSQPGGGGAVNFTWTSPNKFDGNIVLGDFTGSMTTGGGGTTSGAGYNQGSGYPVTGAFANPISGNWYHNYAGGTISTSGSVAGDSNPIQFNPACGGYLYALSSPPTGWTPIVGNWGPQGQVSTFVIPTSTNHSCP